MSMASIASREWVNVQSPADREYPTELSGLKSAAQPTFPLNMSTDRSLASSDPPQRHAGEAGTRGGSASGTGKRTNAKRKGKVSRK